MKTTMETKQNGQTERTNQTEQTEQTEQIEPTEQTEQTEQGVTEFIDTDSVENTTDSEANTGATENVQTNIQPHYVQHASINLSRPRRPSRLSSRLDNDTLNETPEGRAILRNIERRNRK